MFHFVAQECNPLIVLLYQTMNNTLFSKMNLREVTDNILFLQKKRQFPLFIRCLPKVYRFQKKISLN